MQGGQDAKECNRWGKCCKNIGEYSISPIMIRCKECDKIYCVACGMNMHVESGHNIFFLTNSTLKKFSCVEPGRRHSLSHPAQQIPPSPESFPLDNFIIQGDYCTYTSNQILVPDGEKECILYYTEISFAELYTEDIAVEIVNTGIIFDNIRNNCTKNNVMVCRMPRFGSLDTLGIGITADKHVFFTYCGFNLLKYIRFYQDEVQISIRIKNVKKSLLESGVKSLYIGDAFDYFEKDMIHEYSKIILSYIMLSKFKDLATSHNDNDRVNMYSVLDDLGSLYPQQIRNKIYSSIRERTGTQCKIY